MILETPTSFPKSTTSGSSGPIPDASMIADCPRWRISFTSVRCEFVGNGTGNTCSHDLALESPVVQILQIAAEDSEHEFHSEILQDREIQQCLRDRRLREQACLDEDAEDLPPELGNILKNGSQITFLDHAAMLSTNFKFQISNFVATPL